MNFVVGKLIMILIICTIILIIIMIKLIEAEEEMKIIPINYYNPIHMINFYL